ncbi:MAG: hypothetical protein GY795_43280 [Desulfobacterales bacterium]|nr:hypothetical protein [Desulfobacterales bacterium]
MLIISCKYIPESETGPEGTEKETVLFVSAMIKKRLNRPGTGIEDQAAEVFVS